MTVKNDQGIDIPLGNIGSGYFVFSQSFDDYGIIANKPYHLHNDGDSTGTYFFAGSGCINVWRNELRPDVLETCIWKQTLN